MHSGRTLDNLQLSFLKELTHDSSVEVAHIFHDFFKTEDTILLWSHKSIASHSKREELIQATKQPASGTPTALKQPAWVPKLPTGTNDARNIFPTDTRVIEQLWDSQIV